MKNNLFIVALLLITGCTTVQVTDNNFQDALDAYNNGKYQSAISYLNVAIEENPNQAAYFVWRGKSYLKLEITEEAIKDFKKALAINDDYEVNFLLGKSFSHKGEYLIAVNYFNKSLDQNSSFSEALFNRAYTYYQLNEFDNAVEDYKKVVGLEPRNSTAMVNLGHIFGLFGMREDAIKYYSLAIEVNPMDFNAYYNRANEKIFSNNYPEAISDLIKASELMPGNSDVLMLLGECRLQTGDYQSAFTNFTKVIFSDSSNSKAFYLRGLANLNLDRKITACEDLQHAGEMGYFKAYELIKKYCEQKKR